MPLTRENIANPLFVRLHAGLRIDGARLHLHFRAQGIGVDVLVALEPYTRNDGILDDDDDDRGVLPANTDVFEKTGGEKGLEGLIDLTRVVGVARGEGQVGPDRFGFDALIALDNDGTDRGVLGNGCEVAKARAEDQRERDATHH